MTLEKSYLLVIYLSTLNVLNVKNHEERTTNNLNSDARIT